MHTVCTAPLHLKADKLYLPSFLFLGPNKKKGEDKEKQKKKNLENNDPDAPLLSVTTPETSQPPLVFWEFLKYVRNPKISSINL